MNPDKASACFQWLGLLNKIVLNSVCPQYPYSGKRWVWAAGNSVKTGLSNGPKGLMLLGCEHPFANGAAVPGQHARGMQRYLSAHGPRCSPVKGYLQQLCQGLVKHTLYIYFHAYMCKLRCLGQTSQLPSAVHNMKRLTVQEQKRLCILQKSYSCSILIFSEMQPVLTLGTETRKNQRFSRCPPVDFSLSDPLFCSSPADIPSALRFRWQRVH